MLALAMLPVFLSFSSCKQKPASDLAGEPLIPKPLSVTSTGDYFQLGENSSVVYHGNSEDVMKIAGYLADMLRPATGFDLPVSQSELNPGKGGISLALNGNTPDASDESYEINISAKNIELTAATPAGLFRSVQTLRQLFPAAIEKSTKQDADWAVATGKISDKPAYEYRGMMLDVARHFFGVNDVKRVIDFLAAYRMNVLHLHLSDDQGWRIEIKSWPQLALHGGSTQVGGGQGGYYTQEQYSELVKYAADRYITIVPEIDMPGHTNAALASYAELNCNGKATELYTGTNVGFSSFCTGKELTYKFINDVVGEITALSPGPYFHIGGDESHATKIEDYIPFINKVQDIVVAHGKTVIGWDEIALTTMRPGAIAQDWASEKNAKAAVEQGAKIIMSPASKAYSDMKYDSTTVLGLHWAGYIEVDSAYIWDPAKIIAGVGAQNIKGIETALWSETLTKISEIEYMLFPRLPGYAEIGWTPANARNWDEYKVRLAKQGERMNAMGINFYKSPLVPWPAPESAAQ